MASIFTGPLPRFLIISSCLERLEAGPRIFERAARRRACHKAIRVINVEGARRTGTPALQFHNLDQRPELRGFDILIHGRRTGQDRHTHYSAQN